MTRIIAGTAGGRRLRTPPGDGTRPTSDRVREALFSMLEARGLVRGARVLDLFAGSGALGLEAASRGADDVVLVDSARQAVTVALANAGTVGAGRVTVVQSTALRYLTRSPARPPGSPAAESSARSPVAQVDLVLLDPPYALDEPALAEHLAALVSGGWLAPDAIVVVERGGRSPEPTWPAGLTGDRVRRYGDTAVWTATRTGSAEGSGPEEGEGEPS